MPLIATATSASELFSAPCAIAHAQAQDTAPNVSMISGETDSNCFFAWLE
jgi:hypothetical protein